MREKNPQKYYIVGSVPKSNLKIVETEAKLIPQAHVIHDRSRQPFVKPGACIERQNLFIYNIEV